ncbi:MAG: RrF2 family transcriptional regulator [Myxococcota bacterium]
MRLSLQVQYAICGLFDLAYNGQGEPVQVRVISERQAVPTRYLEQIFRRLRQASLVTSKRGPGGGYTLARAPSAITLRQVLEAVEGPVAESLAMDPDPEGGTFRPDFVWQELADRFSLALEETTLDSLCRQAERAQVPRAESEAPMWFI